MAYIDNIAGLPRSSSMGMIHEAKDEMLYDVPDTEEALRRGEYTVIRSLVRVLEVSIFVEYLLCPAGICWCGTCFVAPLFLVALVA